MPFRTGYVRLSAGDSARIVRAARRRFRRHNAGRRFVEAEVFAALASSWRGEPPATSGEVRAALRTHPDVRAALERMWPVLTPAQLLHDLFGSEALLRLAGGGDLHRRRACRARTGRGPNDVDDVRWTPADVALLDDAREVLGPRIGRSGKSDDADEIRTYGHIVVDEVQDLTPMQLKMATRRSLNGSMTVVGDLAQATGPLAPSSWDDVLAHLPDRKPARVVGLSVGYRIPAQIMALADRVLRAAAPQLHPPRAVRIGDTPPVIVAAEPGRQLPVAVAEATAKMVAELPEGNVAVIVDDEQADGDLGRPRRRRHRARPGGADRARRQRHGGAGQRRQGTRARRRGRRGTGPHRRRRRSRWPAGAVRRPHSAHAAPRRRPRRRPAACDEVSMKAVRASERLRATASAERQQGSLRSACVAGERNCVCVAGERNEMQASRRWTS